MHIRSRGKLALLALFLALPVAAELPARLTLCKACHDEDGSGVGRAFVPIIAGMPAAHVEEALFAYKDGARQCQQVPLMCETAASLSDEEITELAEYYGALPRYSHATTFQEKLAAAGEQVHQRLCARCHFPPDDPDVAEALGPPLHGQRADYLKYALASYLNGNRENLLAEMEEKVNELRHGEIEALVNFYVSY